MRNSHDAHCGSVCRSEKSLREAHEFYSVLLGMAGHDLRQPLQVIQMTYDRLDAAGLSAEQLRRGRKAVQRLTEQLDQLVGAMRIYEQAAGMSLTAVRLGPLFEALCRDHRELALRRGVEVRACETDAVVVSNPVLLDGVVRNLLQNAIKYTPQGGRILLGARRRGPDIRIDICDTGIGIAPDRMPRVFEAFSRLDTAQAEGLGLGLYVVRRAVGLLGHRIEVRSRVGSGSRFSVLALRAAPAAPAASTIRARDAA
jgi:signal transduction histidine kinase